MLLKEFQDYVMLLETSSTKPGIDELRQQYAKTEQGICVQRILGNFWDDPTLVKNINVVVEALSVHVGSGSSFITNRFALIVQLIKNPNLSEGDLKILNFRLEGMCGAVKDTVREAILMIGDNKSAVWGSTLSDKANIDTSVVTFVISEIYNRRTNLGAYILMSNLGTVTPNFDAFVRQPLVKEKIKEGVMSATTSRTLTKRAKDVIEALYPELYNKSIYGKDYHRE